MGVDKLDQLCTYYSFLHKSVKWWRKVFFWLLEVAVVNSYIISKHSMGQLGRKPLTHLAFRRQLLTALSEPIRSTAVPRSRSHSRQHGSIERLQPVPYFLEKGNKRRDCWVCSDREEGGTSHLTQFYCTCTDQPALCPAPCYKIYHTRKNYCSST